MFHFYYSYSNLSLQIPVLSYSEVLSTLAPRCSSLFDENKGVDFLRSKFALLINFEYYVIVSNFAFPRTCYSLPIFGPSPPSSWHYIILGENISISSSAVSRLRTAYLLSLNSTYKSTWVNRSRVGHFWLSRNSQLSEESPSFWTFLFWILSTLCYFLRRSGLSRSSLFLSLSVYII